MTQDRPRSPWVVGLLIILVSFLLIIVAPVVVRSFTGANERPAGTHYDNGTPKVSAPGTRDKQGKDHGAASSTTPTQSTTNNTTSDAPDLSQVRPNAGPPNVNTPGSLR